MAAMTVQLRQTSDSPNNAPHKIDQDLLEEDAFVFVQSLPKEETTLPSLSKKRQAGVHSLSAFSSSNFADCPKSVHKPRKSKSSVGNEENVDDNVPSKTVKTVVQLDEAETTCKPRYVDSLQTPDFSQEVEQHEDDKADFEDGQPNSQPQAASSDELISLAARDISSKTKTTTFNKDSLHTQYFLRGIKRSVDSDTEEEDALTDYQTEKSDDVLHCKRFKTAQSNKDSEEQENNSFHTLKEQSSLGLSSNLSNFKLSDSQSREPGDNYTLTKEGSSPQFNTNCASIENSPVHESEVGIHNDSLLTSNFGDCKIVKNFLGMPAMVYTSLFLN